MTREEMIVKARTAKTPEELLQMAHEAGMTDITEKEAESYFNVLNQNRTTGDKKSGELADEELDVSAGGCEKGGHLVVTRGNLCSHGWSEHINGAWVFTNWKCKTCKEVPGAGVNNFSYNDMTKIRKTCSCNRSTIDDFAYAIGVSANFNAVGVCGSCDWCKYTDGVWICTEPHDVM